MDFDRSTEREFTLLVNRRAIENCDNLDSLKNLAKQLLESWSSQQDVVQKLAMENLELAAAAALATIDAKCAEDLLEETVKAYDEKCERLLLESKRRPWPFRWLGGK